MAGLDLSKMVGPLPLGAWILVSAAGVGIYAYNKRQQTPVNTLDNSTGANGADTSGAPSEFIQTNPPTNTSNPPQDNEEWAKQAIDWLIAMGYDPAVSDAAIRKYIDGTVQLGAQEYALVKMALFHLGSPPSPLPPPIFGPPTLPPKPKPKPVPKPKPKPVPKPAHKSPHTYVVQRGDTLSAIASRFLHSSAKWREIYGANKKVIGNNPNVIRPGERLVIPAS